MNAAARRAPSVSTCSDRTGRSSASTSTRPIHAGVDVAESSRGPARYCASRSGTFTCHLKWWPSGQHSNGR